MISRYIYIYIYIYIWFFCYTRGYMYREKRVPYILSRVLRSSEERQRWVSTGGGGGGIIFFSSFFWIIFFSPRLYDTVPSLLALRRRRRRQGRSNTRANDSRQPCNCRLLLRHLGEIHSSRLDYSWPPRGFRAPLTHAIFVNGRPV